MNSDTPRRHPRIGLIILGIIAAAIIAVAIIIAPYFFTGAAHAAIIRIPRQAKVENVTDSISKYFGRDYAQRTTRVFNTLASSPASRYGAYEIPEGASPAEAGKILARGSQASVSLTINGVRELLPFCSRIAAKFDFPADSLRALLADPAVMARYSLTPEQAPALFLNDTYYFYWTATPMQIIEKLGANYQKLWNEKRRAQADSLGLTPAEVMTLASIVDEESNQIGEKGRIGRLYINRLNIGMRLQSDPTVRFALHDFTIKRVTGTHLNAPGPYNTYRVKGLPPGPIRTTSQATIDAILNSTPTEDLYMCARPDFSGYHDFARDYETHLRYARRYQQALDSLNIK